MNRGSGAARRSLARATAIAKVALPLLVCFVAIPANQVSASPEVRAGDNAAKDRVIEGVMLARTYYTDGATYRGFDAAKAKAWSAYHYWADGSAMTKRIVGIPDHGPVRVMVETLSGSGASFCGATDDRRSLHGTFYGMDPAGQDFAGYRGCKNAPVLWSP